MASNRPKLEPRPSISSLFTLLDTWKFLKSRVLLFLIKIAKKKKLAESQKHSNVCESRSVVSNSLWQSMEFSRPGTGVGSLSLLQWIFLTQELIQPLLHCRQILYQLSYQGSPHDVRSLFLDGSAKILFYMHMCRGRKNKCGKILRTGESRWRVYECSIYIIWLFLWVGNSK